MATEIRASRVPNIQVASTAGGGTALTTTVGYIPFLEKTQWVSLTALNAGTAATDVAQILLMPYLVVLRTDDALATAPTDYSSAAQDGDTATSIILDDLDTAANDGYLYVGSHVPFRGVYIDQGAANGNASVLTVKYRKNDATWADISDTDGTASGGATIAQDGTVTWTVPSDWEKADLRETGDSTLAAGPGYGPMYWTRWEVSAALDAEVEIDEMYGLNQSSTYGELIDTQSIEGVIVKGVGGYSGVEAKSDVTINLVVNCDVAEGGL